MSDFTKDNYRSILDGIIHIVKKAAEVFEAAQNWYQKNAEKINEYLTNGVCFVHATSQSR